MMHKKISINSIFPNLRNIKSPLNMQQVEIKAKSSTVAITWLSIAGSLPSNCAGLLTFAFSIRHGNATPRQAFYHFDVKTGSYALKGYSVYGNQKRIKKNYNICLFLPNWIITFFFFRICRLGHNFYL